MVPAFVVQGIAGAIGISLATGGVALALTTIAVNLAISAILGKILAPDLPNQSRDTKGMQDTIRSNVAPRRVAYGESITGGPYAVLETLGDYNEILNMVIILTGHPIEDVLGVLIENEYIDISGTTNASNDLDASYWVESGKYGTGDAVEHVRIIKNLGWGYADFQYVTDGNAAKCTLDRSRGSLISGALTTTWTQPATTARDSTTGLYTDSGYKLTNCAHVFISLRHNPDVWSGFPQIKFHIKGKRLYNPAQDSNLVAEGADVSPLTHDYNDPDTWEYSENWALCCLDYLLNTSYGLGAKITGLLTEIDWASMIEAYNDSAEQVPSGMNSPYNFFVDRYTVNGIFEVNATPISLMETLLTSGGGQLLYSQGEYRLRAAVYKAPESENYVINEDYMVSGLSIQTHTPRSQVFNKVSGTYVNIGYDRNFAPSNTNLPLFEPTDFPFVDPLDSSGLNPYEVIDEEEIIREFDFPFTIHSYEAQRLARIQLERIRQGLTISFEGNLKMLKFSVGDNVYLEVFNNPKYSNEAFFNRLGLDDAVQAQTPPLTNPYYKQFKIIDMQYTENFTIAVTMVEESEEIYDWNEGDANNIDYALISELVFDDPTGDIIKPSFIMFSPSQPIVEVISWPNVSTLVLWSAPSRGSQLNALDRANIRSYVLEYGIVTNPSAELPDRVTEWIKGGGFIVSDPSLNVQGPISLENLFIDEQTVFDFRIKAVLFNGRSSNWAYYSDEIGSDYSPLVPPIAGTSIPVAGAKTFVYDTQVTSFDTGVGFNAGEFAIWENAAANKFLPTSYLNVERLYLSIKDVNGFNIAGFMANMRNRDVVTIYISSTRWFKYRFNNSAATVSFTATNTETSPVVNFENSVIGLLGMELIDYKDSTDPDDMTLITSNIEFRFERDNYNSDLVNILDLNFDSTTQDLFDNPNTLTYWESSGSINSPNFVEFQETGGQDGTGAVALNVVSAAAGLVGISSSFLVRTYGDIKVTVKYQSNVGGDGNSYLRMRIWSYPGIAKDSSVVEDNKNIYFQPTGSGVWKTCSAYFDRPSLPFFNLIIDFIGGGDNKEIIIDSILLERVEISTNTSVLLSSNVASISVENSGYFEVDMNAATSNVTINIISDLPATFSGEFAIKTIQDTTSRTITWENNGVASNILWAGGSVPTPTSTSQAEDLYIFRTVDGGTNWIGSVILDVQ